MTNYLNYILLVLLTVCNPAFSSSIADNASFWQCTTEDESNKSWTAKSKYQKAALNIAFAQCKKESVTPSSCKASNSSCEGFNQGVSTKPQWRCTALDRAADAWPSNFYTQRDDAALAAKDFCKDKSSVPETCYVNFVTCLNVTEDSE